MIFRRPSTSPDRLAGNSVSGDDERSIGSSSWTVREGEESPGQSGSSRIDPSEHAAPTSGDAAVIDIMSVNADSVVQTMLGRIAQEYGLGFQPVRSGEKALEKLSKKLPTLILMGNGLPGRDGYETTREIRKLYPNAALPVIMITACDSESTVQQTFEAGANDLVVIKPLVKGNLVARIGAQLRTLHFWRGQLESRQNEILLKEMLPGPIIKRLKDGERLIHDKLDEVSIIFTDIVSFTTLSSSHPTPHVIQMLDTLFSEFDKLTDKYGIYKVETIGDAYMAVAGLNSSTREGHCAHDAINLAADMVAAAKKNQNAEWRTHRDPGRCTHWPCPCRCRWPQDAAILPFWRYSKHGQPNGEHKFCWLRAAEQCHTCRLHERRLCSSRGPDLIDLSWRA